MTCSSESGWVSGRGSNSISSIIGLARNSLVLHVPLSTSTGIDGGGEHIIEDGRLAALDFFFFRSDVVRDLMSVDF